MTLLVAGLTTALALLAGAAFTVFVDPASDRVRAQAAADAAALAAVAESAPGAAANHRAEAARFAAANGGTLVSCDCRAGTTSVEVTVEVDGIRASARATIDPNAFLPALHRPVSRGLHPQLEAAVARLIDAAGGRVRLISGWRSPEHQRRLWADALERYGDPEVADDWVARPGSSFHERGLAVDLGGDLDLAAGLVEQLDLPLHRPLSNEPWHFELLGSR